MEPAFYYAQGDRYLAAPLTRGPWDNRAQHGGPPAALLAGHLERWGADAEDFLVVRVTLELLRPIPLGTMVVSAEMERAGRTVQRLRGVLTVDGAPVLEARALRVRRRPLEVPPAPPLPPWPDPETLPSFVFPFFQHPVGYHTAVDLRVASGAWGSTPVGFWARPRVPLVAERPLSPLERTLILADAQSGMGIPLDPARYTFVNPDLTLYIERPAAGHWLGFDIRSAAFGAGTGLSQSAIRDARGAVGRSAQSLVVTAR